MGGFEFWVNLVGNSGMCLAFSSADLVAWHMLRKFCEAYWALVHPKRLRGFHLPVLAFSLRAARRLPLRVLDVFKICWEGLWELAGSFCRSLIWR